MSTFTPLKKALRKQTPREIDMQLAQLHEMMAKHLVDYQWLEAAVARAKSDAAREHAEKERLASFNIRVELLGHMSVFNREFDRRGGWKRYFRTLGRDGHVHRERDCSTCRPKTYFGWMPELSDCDETVMVTEHGDAACAVCFPDVVTHPAYIAGAALRKAHEDALRAAQCPMSAQEVERRYLTPNGRYAECPSCGKRVPLTKYRKFRQHGAQ